MEAGGEEYGSEVSSIVYCYDVYATYVQIVNP